VERAPVHLTHRSPSWPRELTHIDAPPDELWVRGRIELLARTPRVAVVGTRAPTPYGEAQARRFAGALAAQGVAIVSGLARGIDQAAHAAALDAGGATIAVLGCGVDRPWPEGALTERVAREGVLVSEFAPGAPPRRHHFPQRNRVISGLSSAVLVIEAAHASGSLITAHWAADQNRLVFALPGRVDHPMARGCHRLIREGASLVESPDDVLEELGLARARDAPAAETAGAASDGDRTSHGLHETLLAALRGETLSSDELCERTSQGLADVLTALVELELAGRVTRGAGALYRLA
jgi:DNA processing protein